jgi:hypothetical protein
VRSEIGEMARATTKAKYLYLAQQSFADTWLNGGSVPVMPARTYLSDVRDRTRTPDEVMQKAISGAGLDQLAASGVLIGGQGTIGHLQFDDCSFNGVRIPRVTYSQAAEDALILCLCNTLDRQIMTGLGHSTGVVIRSVAALQQCLDAQIGVPSRCGSVTYTRERGNRSHFMKGTEDSWQDEYRLVWRGSGLGVEPVWVDIPAGIAAPLPVDPE